MVQLAKIMGGCKNSRQYAINTFPSALHALSNVLRTHTHTQSRIEMTLSYFYRKKPSH